MRTTRAPAPRRRAVALALLALAVAAAGCGPRAARLERVTIRNMAFAPERLAVSPGDTVEWDNRDIVPHTATSASGRWDTGNIGPDSSARVVIPADGIGPYRCGYHPAMTASLARR